MFIQMHKGSGHDGQPPGMDGTHHRVQGGPQLSSAGLKIDAGHARASQSSSNN